VSQAIYRCLWEGKAKQQHVGLIWKWNQTFNRRVVQSALEGTLRLTGSVSSSFVSDEPVNVPAANPARCELVFAIPDHPWVDSTDGAAVRIAMTVVQRAALAKMGSDPDFAQQNSGSDPIFADSGAGRLLTVADEQPGSEGEVLVTLAERRGQFPATYQWLLERVKPERNQNNRSS
jgi:hypothetical protein